MKINISILLALYAAENVLCTTEWFGDLRAHLNPPQNPPFYDIVYDESDCPFGLESMAIPGYVYFGEMIATKSVREHSVCLQHCLDTPRCKAINYFESLDKKESGMGFCELLVETQLDNPRLMRPFRKATYYEKIRCRTSAETEEEEQPFKFDGNEGKELLLLAANENNGGKSPKKMDGEENRRTESNNNAQKVVENGGKGRSNPPAEMMNSRWNLEKETMLKKLAQKVHEFNLRFRS